MKTIVVLFVAAVLLSIQTASAQKKMCTTNQMLELSFSKSSVEGSKIFNIETQSHWTLLTDGWWKEENGKCVMTVKKYGSDMIMKPGEMYRWHISVKDIPFQSLQTAVNYGCSVEVIKGSPRKLITENPTFWNNVIHGQGFVVDSENYFIIQLVNFSDQVILTDEVWVKIDFHPFFF